MKKLNVLKLNPLMTCVLLLFILFLTNKANAERFFQKDSTWYQKIPSNPILAPNSAGIVNDIVTYATFPDYGGGCFYLGAGTNEWSDPTYYAQATDPIVTVNITTTDQALKDWIINNQWNKVPLTPNYLPAGNVAACAGQYRDGHLNIISYDKHWAWDFYKAKFCNGVWSAQSVRKWDLTTDGVVWPDDYKGNTKFTLVPGFIGLITMNDILSGVINHAMFYNYYHGKAEVHSQTYPSGRLYVGGVVCATQACCTANPQYCKNGVPRPYVMLGGERLQLDPSVDCNSYGFDKLMKMVCVAMQEYGMIFADGTSGSMGISFTNTPGENWAQFPQWNKCINNFPLNKLRVIQPVCTDCSICPNCSSTTPDTSVPPGTPILNK